MAESSLPILLRVCQHCVKTLLLRLAPISPAIVLHVKLKSTHLNANRCYTARVPRQVQVFGGSVHPTVRWCEPIPTFDSASSLAGYRAHWSILHSGVQFLFCGLLLSHNTISPGRRQRSCSRTPYEGHVGITKRQAKAICKASKLDEGHKRQGVNHMLDRRDGGDAKNRWK